MSERELDDPADPPENQGGGNGEIALDAPEADPPENQGGGGNS